MKTFIASALVAGLASAGAAVHGSKVCVANSAGFDLHWWNTDLNLGESGPTSKNYPIDQTVCQAIAVPGISDGDFVETYIHADGGTTQAVDSAIIYQSSPAITVTYTCTGATLTYNCRLNGEAYLQQLKDLEMWDALELAAEHLKMPEFYLN